MTIKMATECQEQPLLLGNFGAVKMTMSYASIRLPGLFLRVLCVVAINCFCLTACNGEEREMFESSGVIEWGGVSLEFSKGESTQSIAFSVDDRMLKIKSPTVKGAFEIDKVDSLRFERKSPEKGVLSVRFSSDLGGREMVLGSVSDDHWVTFRDRVKSYLKIEER